MHFYSCLLMRFIALLRTNLPWYRKTKSPLYDSPAGESASEERLAAPDPLFLGVSPSSRQEAGGCGKEGSAEW